MVMVMMMMVLVQQNLVSEWFSSPAAGLMHKFQAHAATDVTGFGLLGHAHNLAAAQRSEVAFVIHNLPVIAKMAAISKACGNMFNLIQGTSAETSGTTDPHEDRCVCVCV